MIVPLPRGKRDMSSLQGCCTLCSILLLLGGNLGVVVEIRQDLVNGTVGQSVLLPVSYTLSSASGFPLAIFWTFHNSSDRLTSCTVQNCSLGAGGVPSDCFANCFTHATYHGRAELFPQNGSLLLRDLQLRDSGVYNVTFISSHQTWDITLTVHEQCRTPENPGKRTEKPEFYYIPGICSSVLLLLFLFICFKWRWGAAQQKKGRTTKQQQVSSVEEFHMQRPAVRDMATIYARIGDSFEQPQPRPTSEVVYTTITSDPEPDAGYYHVLA
ncbi:uncharacterized protein LOC129211640 isoform X2 [Grus americana]|uniref:uncharacterized protein LOC129211640 isoform X2 n=1 Tax=Grus americana TaxID=9117 RepID=UPI002407D01E|nr:uncharacterized protein LOC129211640 isoform X2 [Grus americana]